MDNLEPVYAGIAADTLAVLEKPGHHCAHSIALTIEIPEEI
jgi:hypothetical protein